MTDVRRTSARIPSARTIPAAGGWSWPADADQRRRAYRAFARDHHPDVGGDPAVFAAGTTSYRSIEDTHRPSGRDSAPIQPHQTYAHRTYWWQLGGVTTWVGRRVRRRLRPRVR